MKILGLDLSINSTGVCLNKNGKYYYTIITSKLTKKQANFSHSHLKIIEYEKTQPVGEYSEKETIKTNNINNIVECVKTILNSTKPDLVNIEGISYGSTGSAALIDLTGLNYMIRKLLIDRKVPFQIISPTQNKKFATGNGGAEKDVMINAWKRLDPKFADVIEIKVDDLADAFFLSCYQK